MSDPDQAGPSGDDGEPTPIRMFGDPLSAYVQRGPERRTVADDIAAEAARRDAEAHLAAPRSTGAGRALRLGRGDNFATVLNVLALIVFAVSVIAGSLILYNAKNVGAFSNPWDSSRVAIGLVVLGVGIVHTAILLGVARAITYQLAALRLRMREVDLATIVATAAVRPASSPSPGPDAADADGAAE